MKSRSKRKGISPLISVILLIAFTMVVAGILAAWATQFVQVRQSEFVKCADARILIQSSYYDNGTQQLYTNVFNNGKVDLDGFTFIVTLENSSILSTNFDNTTVLSGGVGTFNMTSSSNVKEVSLRSRQCQGAQDSIGKYYIQGIGY
ncbi:MAG: hypothetical protein JW716_02190 [Candidatus Aenigmarchaeota archaeon]|nr:hypothetical protein [Candidatus Aenigmarchaeota archaeon]